MVNSEYGGIWLLELTNSKLTSQTDSSVSSMNEKGMATTNITFLLARKFDVGKMNQKESSRSSREPTRTFGLVKKREQYGNLDWAKKRAKEGQINKK